MSDPPLDILKKIKCILTLGIGVVDKLDASIHVFGSNLVHGLFDILSGSCGVVKGSRSIRPYIHTVWDDQMTSVINTVSISWPSSYATICRYNSGASNIHVSYFYIGHGHVHATQSGRLIRVPKPVLPTHLIQWMYSAGRRWIG